MTVVFCLIVFLVLVAKLATGGARRAGSDDLRHGGTFVNPANGNVMFDNMTDVNGNLYGHG